MVKTLIKDNQQIKQKSEMPITRLYESEAFEADTTEERPVALLAERRRQFLAGLKARQVQADSPGDQ